MSGDGRLSHLGPWVLLAPTGRGQGCFWTSHSAQDGPHNKAFDLTSIVFYTESLGPSPQTTAPTPRQPQWGEGGCWEKSWKQLPGGREGGGCQQIPSTKQLRSPRPAWPNPLSNRTLKCSLWAPTCFSSTTLRKGGSKSAAATRLCK